MKPDYRDITSLIEEPPTWHDINGTPRYGAPRPTETNIYARESIAVVIGCQGCDQEFMVVYDFDRYDFSYTSYGWSGNGERLYRMNINKESMVDNARDGNAPSYGDPPIHGCVGDTMSSYSIATRGWWKAESEDPKILPWNREFITCNWPGSPDWAKELLNY